MKEHLALLMAFAMSTVLVGNAYAHTSEMVGDYKVQVGWVFEPPMAGKKNAIELVITHATDADREHASLQEESHNSHGEGSSHGTQHTSMDHGMADVTHVSDNSDDHTGHKMSNIPKSGITGLRNLLEADVTLNNAKTFLKITESKLRPGVYYGVYSPEAAGFPLVHVVGNIKGTLFEITFHPERIESGH